VPARAQALQPALDDVTVSWNFPAPTAPAAAPVPATAAAPAVRTLLGYRSPSLDAPAAPAASPAVLARVFPCKAPPAFSGERFLSFALFGAGAAHALPESVTVTAASQDGPLRATLPVGPPFHGRTAHRLAARAALRDAEGAPPGATGAAGAVEEARGLALRHGLASAHTAFVAVREGGSAGAAPAGAARVVPQLAPPGRAWAGEACGAAPTAMMLCCSAPPPPPPPQRAATRGPPTRVLATRGLTRGVAAAGEALRFRAGAPAPPSPAAEAPRVFCRPGGAVPEEDACEGGAAGAAGAGDGMLALCLLQVPPAPRPPPLSSAPACSTPRATPDA
jgi:hypothetical protein